MGSSKVIDRPDTADSQDRCETPTSQRLVDLKRSSHSHETLRSRSSSPLDERDRVSYLALYRPQSRTSNGHRGTNVTGQLAGPPLANHNIQDVAGHSSGSDSEATTHVDFEDEIEGKLTLFESNVICERPAVHSLADEKIVDHCEEKAYSGSDELGPEIGLTQRHDELQCSTPTKRTPDTPRAESPSISPARYSRAKSSNRTAPSLRATRPTSPSVSLHSSSNWSHKISGIHTNSQKEYPLVLLRCSIHAKLPQFDQRILESVLPQDLLKDLALLHQRISQNFNDRGLLLTHPGDDYELLEERILESLQLKSARITKCGHYMVINRQEPEHIAQDDRPKCVICSRYVSTPEKEVRRAWDIAVYAANGLMRAGAWGTAWREMEQVDVEISVFIPDILLRELELERTRQIAFASPTSSHKGSLDHAGSVDIPKGLEEKKEQIAQDSNRKIADSRQTPLKVLLVSYVRTRFTAFFRTGNLIQVFTVAFLAMTLSRAWSYAPANTRLLELPTTTPEATREAEWMQHTSTWCVFAPHDAAQNEMAAVPLSWLSQKVAELPSVDINPDTRGNYQTAVARIGGSETVSKPMATSAAQPPHVFNAVD